MATLLETKQVTLTYYPEVEMLVQEWSGFATEQEFVDAINETLRISKEKSVKKLLTDAREQNVVNRSATNYAAHSMLQLEKNGLEKMALILPNNLFTQVSVEHFTEEVRHGQLQYFDNKEDALAWLGVSMDWS